MFRKIKHTFLFGPLFFVVFCFFLGLLPPCFNHGPHGFLSFFRIFKLLHGSGSTDFTALLCFTKEKIEMVGLSTHIGGKKKICLQKKVPHVKETVRNELQNVAALNLEVNIVEPPASKALIKLSLVLKWGSLTEGAAGSHSGNQKCHSIDLKHFAVGSLCGIYPETADAHHLSICLHRSV